MGFQNQKAKPIRRLFLLRNPFALAGFGSKRMRDSSLECCEHVKHLTSIARSRHQHLKPQICSRHQQLKPQICSRHQQMKPQIWQPNPSKKYLWMELVGCCWNCRLRLLGFSSPPAWKDKGTACNELGTHRLNHKEDCNMHESIQTCQKYPKVSQTCGFFGLPVVEAGVQPGA